MITLREALITIATGAALTGGTILAVAYDGWLGCLGVGIVVAAFGTLGFLWGNT